MKSLLQTIQLLFFPKKFREADVDHIRALNSKGMVTGDSDEKRILKKRKGLIVSFLIVAGLVVAGLFAATLVNQTCPLSLASVRWIRVASVIIIAWSVFGRLGYETETYKGQTLLEITSLRAFKQFYGLGVFLATFGLFLDASGV